MQSSSAAVYMTTKRRKCSVPFWKRSATAAYSGLLSNRAIRRDFEAANEEAANWGGLSILVGDRAVLPDADAARIVTRCDARPAGAIARGATALVTEGTGNAVFNCAHRVRLGGCRSREYQRNCNSENEAHIVLLARASKKPKPAIYYRSRDGWSQG